MQRWNKELWLFLTNQSVFFSVAPAQPIILQMLILVPDN